MHVLDSIEDDVEFGLIKRVEHERLEKFCLKQILLSARFGENRRHEVFLSVVGTKDLSRDTLTLFARLRRHFDLFLLAVLRAFISFSMIVVFADLRLQTLILLSQVFHLGDLQVRGKLRCLNTVSLLFEESVHEGDRIMRLLLEQCLHELNDHIAVNLFDHFTCRTLHLIQTH